MGPQMMAPSLGMRPSVSCIAPPEPEPPVSVEALWEGYVSQLTGILLRHLPDLWHVLHVRPPKHTLT